jgi:hypothetical protein
VSFFLSGGGGVSNEPQATPRLEIFKDLSKWLEFSDGTKIQVASDVQEACLPSFDTADPYSCSVTCEELQEHGKRGVLISQQLVIYMPIPSAAHSTDSRCHLHSVPESLLRNYGLLGLILIVLVCFTV